MNEQWREIPNTDYSVSNEGKVASRKFGKWKILVHTMNRKGYPTVCLQTRERKQIVVPVHRLVAEAFLGPRPTPKHQVNHKSGIKTGNHVENLEWCTSSENNRHRFDVLKKSAPHGSLVGTAKLDEPKVRGILARCKGGEPQREIALAYGICQGTVSAIVCGKNWAWLTKEAL